MQKNWIGRSEGLLVRFALDAATHARGRRELEVFTTRPDTLFGARFMAIAPDHPLAHGASAAKNPTLADFIAECKPHGTARPSDRDRREEGLRHRHRARPSVRSKDWTLPVYVANFVLMDYGTGAIFGCPAHDQRDLDFVTQVRPRRSRRWCCPPGAGRRRPSSSPTTAYDGDGRMINSRFLDGMTIADAKEEVASRLESDRSTGKPSGRAPGRTTACATGASRGSATGAARSR